MPKIGNRRRCVAEFSESNILVYPEISNKADQSHKYTLSTWPYILERRTQVFIGHSSGPRQSQPQAKHTSYLFKALHNNILFHASMVPISRQVICTLTLLSLRNGIARAHSGDKNDFHKISIEKVDVNVKQKSYTKQF